MVKEELGLLLVVKAVESAGFKVVEGVVSGSKNGHSLRSVVELILQLSYEFALVEEAD